MFINRTTGVMETESTSTVIFTEFTSEVPIWLDTSSPPEEEEQSLLKYRLDMILRTETYSSILTREESFALY